MVYIFVRLKTLMCLSRLKQFGPSTNIFGKIAKELGVVIVLSLFGVRRDFIIIQLL